MSVPGPVITQLNMGNSESKSNDQGMLVGQISSYCLVCEMPLKNSEITAHFLTPHHKENLEKNCVNEDLKLDGIRKVPKGYYCKYCNLYLRSFAKVNVHTSSTVHINLKSGNSAPAQNQGCTKLELKDDHVLAFDCVKIKLDAWNGVLNNTCLVCDMDVENVSEHCTLAEHGINLIQAYVLEKNYHLYRKLDEISVQCLTCNSIILASDLTKHFDSKSHEIKLKNASDGHINKKDVSNYDVNQKFMINDYFDMFEENEGGLCLMCLWNIDIEKISAHTHGYHHLKMIELYKAWVEQKKWVKIDVAKNAEVIPLYGVLFDDQSDDTALKTDNNNVIYEIDKNKTKKTVHIGKLISESIQNFVSEKDEENCENANSTDNDSKKFNVEDTNESKEIPKETILTNKNKKENADKENISPNIDPSQPSTSRSSLTTEKRTEQSIEDFAQEYGIKYKVKGITTCTICNERVRGTIEDMKTHIQSSKHKKKFFKTTKISRYNYESRRMQDYHNFSFTVNLVMHNHVIVNGAFCVDIFSYQCFVPEGDKLRCVLCNKLLDDKKRAQHHNTDLHKRLWGNCLVITSFEKELIREVKSGLYHCGFCNITFTIWDQLLDHLMSRRHKMYRMSADKIYKCHFSNDFAQRLGVFLGLMRALNP